MFIFLKKFKAINKNQRGFTLLEINFAIGIFLLVILGIFALFNVSSKANRDVWESSNTQGEASKAVQTFVDELRTTNYSSIGSYPLTYATSTEIIFYSNIDNDNLVERVRYFVESNILKKGITKPSGSDLYSYNTSTEQITELAHNLKTPVGTVFTYYGENYNGASNTSSMSYPIVLPDVRLIQMRLLLKQNSAINAITFEVQTKVQLRNLKTN